MIRRFLIWLNLNFNPEDCPKCRGFLAYEINWGASTVYCDCPLAKRILKMLYLKGTHND